MNRHFGAKKHSGCCNITHQHLRERNVKDIRWNPENHNVDSHFNTAPSFFQANEFIFLDPSLPFYTQNTQNRTATENLIKNLQSQMSQNIEKNEKLVALLNKCILQSILFPNSLTFWK